MSEIRNLFALLWQNYTAMTPAVARINRLLEARGESVINDHIALRTFDREATSIDKLDRAFVDAGYEPIENYEFPDKKLTATHYEHPDGGMPKVFISALLVEQLESEAISLIDGLVAHVNPGEAARWDFCASGRLWPLQYSQYETLLRHSEYAAWVAAFGFCANHFTISVNDLKSFTGLGELNEFLLGEGILLSESGGLIKGSKQDLLLQSSTIAEPISIEFDDRSCEIPSAYYEFAYRFDLPSGKRFQGFVPESANTLFDSTSASGASASAKDRKSGT